MRIAIIGAGIGGLTLALMLRSRGLQSDVFEQAGRIHAFDASASVTA